MNKIVVLPCLRLLLQNIDIFGLTVTFRIFSKNSHKTQFGGFITLIITGIIAYQFLTLTQQVVNLNSPSIIQQQNYVEQPEPFYFRPNTFSFAFGLQDPLGKHFKDEKIYKVKSIMQNNKRIINTQTGKFELIVEQREVKLVTCTEDHFQIEETKQYFLKLPIDDLYCFGIDETEIGVEGEFSALKYGQLNIQIHECIGEGCLEEQERRSKIFSPRLGIYTSDNIIQLTENAKPYKSVGKNLFWASGIDFQKEVRFTLINNYITTDDSIIGSNKRINRIVSFYGDREQVQNRSTSLLYNFFFNYEKNKENVYFRKYMKIDQVFSQVGGTFNILVGIGCLLCWPISQLELNRKIINSVFQIDGNEINSRSDTDQHIILKQKLMNYKENSKIKKNSDYKKNPQFIERQKATSNPQNTDKSNGESTQQQTYGKNDEKIKQIFSQPFNEIKLKLKDYFMQYFEVLINKESKKTKMIRYGTDILYSHVDIFNIVNKLIEIEKLKNLLLSEDQLKLFDYLPKPALKLPQGKLNKSKIQNTNKLTLSFNHEATPKIDPVNQKAQIQGESCLFFTPQKTFNEKALEAYKAFIKIISQSKSKSKIDRRLITMIDPKLLNYFQDKIDKGILQSMFSSPIFSSVNHNKQQDPISIFEIGQEIVNNNKNFIKFNIVDNNNTEEDTINQCYESKIKHQSSKIFGNNYKKDEFNTSNISEIYSIIPKKVQGIVYAPQFNQQNSIKSDIDN